MITVATALGLDVAEELRRDSLPARYSYLVDDESSLPVEPVLLWLCKQYPPKPRMWKANTVECAAHDLCDWWRYLEREGRSWCDATSDDLSEFRDTLLGSVSPRTHRPFAAKTVARRINTVSTFYEWALKKGLFQGEPLDPKQMKPVLRAIDNDALAHTGGGVREVAVSTTAPRTSQSADERVHPMESKAWLAVAQSLGPLPSQRDAGIPGCCRNRLAAEISIWTGMRLDEVAGLTTYQLLDLRSTDDSFEVVPMKITRTKGLRPRTILFPSHLIAEIHRYIDTERRESVEVGKRFGLKKDTGYLFVNGLDSRNHAGKPVRGYTLSSAFRDAVLDCGFVRKEERVDPLTEESYLASCAAHCFHDLRHTFAVWLYQAEKAAGNAEPWKVVQARLGHRYLKTTTDIYLRVVDTFRAKVNDNLYRFLRMTFGT